MRKRLILTGLALTVIVAGVIAMAAFTAQMVNVQARVEKDIAVEPVVCENPRDQETPCFVDPKGGNYGVVLPQEFYDKIIEVTLSNSFFDQTKYDDLAFDILWECKNIKQPETGDPIETDPADSLCREDIADDDLCVELDVNNVPIKVVHCEPQKLDGQLRDHVTVGEFLDPGRCLVAQAATALTPEEKKVDYVATGFLDKNDHKCRYNLKLFAPPCLQGFNKHTDPHPLTDLKLPIDCHRGDKNTDGTDAINPQDLEEFADLGDEFKIQVISHSVAGACNGTNDTCIDADGFATAGDGILTSAQVKVGDPLTAFGSCPGTRGRTYVDMFDNDGDVSWTFGFAGDDLHVEAPFYGGIPDGNHDAGFDPVILDYNGSLVDGQFVNIDLDGARGGPEIPPLMYHDSTGNGCWDTGDDIVEDGNANGIFD